MSNGAVTFGPLSDRDYRRWEQKRAQAMEDDVVVELVAGLPALPPGLLDAHNGVPPTLRSVEKEREIKRQTDREIRDHLRKTQNIRKAQSKRLEGYWDRKRATSAAQPAPTRPPEAPSVPVLPPA